MDSHLPAAPTKTLGQHFSENLNAVLAVGGKQRESGRPGPVTATCIQRQTGIARKVMSIPIRILTHWCVLPTCWGCRQLSC